MASRVPKSSTSEFILDTCEFIEIDSFIEDKSSTFKQLPLSPSISVILQPQDQEETPKMVPQKPEFSSPKNEKIPETPQQKVAKDPKPEENITKIIESDINLLIPVLTFNLLPKSQQEANILNDLSEYLPQNTTITESYCRAQIDLPPLTTENFPQTLTISESYNPAQTLKDFYDFKELELEPQTFPKSNAFQKNFNFFSSRVEENRKKLSNCLEKLDSISKSSRENLGTSCGTNQVFGGQKSASFSKTKDYECSVCHRDGEEKYFRCLICDFFVSCSLCEEMTSHPHLMVRLTKNQIGKIESSLEEMKRKLIPHRI